MGGWVSKRVSARSVNSDQEKSNSPTGNKHKTPSSKIPGLPPKAQRQALERQRKKDKERKSAEKKKEKLKITLDEKIVDAPVELPLLNAFDIMMRRDNLDDSVASASESADTSQSNFIPMHCLPKPMKSQLGQILTAKSRSHSMSSLINIDCSPDLKLYKRTAKELSSPNSPLEATYGRWKSYGASRRDFCLFLIKTDNKPYID